MILLIDAGNTRIKLDWIEPESARRASRVLAFTGDELDGVRRWLAALPRRPERALGVNVAGPVTEAALESLLGCPITWVTPSDQALDVRNGYREAVKLGPDRWAALLGLAGHDTMRPAQGPAPVCSLLAIFGTATTIDTLRPARAVGGHEPQALFEFPGGLILPGPEMMLTSLSTGTANLPRAHSDTALYPIHTHQAIATGVAAAQAGAVMRQWLAGLELCGVPPEVYVSGGAWSMVREETQRLLNVARGRLGLPLQTVHWLDAPVLDGLARLAAT